MDPFKKDLFWFVRGALVSGLLMLGAPLIAPVPAAAVTCNGFDTGWLTFPDTGNHFGVKAEATTTSTARPSIAS